MKKKPTPVEADEPVPASEIAKHYGTTVKTVMEWYHGGKIPAVVAEAKTYRFDKAAVIEALKKRAVERQTT